MNVAAGPELAAAVSNAGGLGVIGGLGYTYVDLPLLSSPPITFSQLMCLTRSPKHLRGSIRELKAALKSPDLRQSIGLINSYPERTAHTSYSLWR